MNIRQQFLITFVEYDDTLPYENENKLLWDLDLKTLKKQRLNFETIERFLQTLLNFAVFKVRHEKLGEAWHSS